MLLALTPSRSLHQSSMTTNRDNLHRDNALGMPPEVKREFSSHFLQLSLWEKELG